MLYVIGTVIGLYSLETIKVMKPAFRKVTEFLRKEWFLFVMLVAITAIIFMFSACNLL
jgi:hypothetical protein